jgi:transcriptional regulator with XRE-family HTH domain
MDYLDRLISERIDRDLTQREVAAIIHKSQQGYDHIEKRRAKLTIEDFIKLCEYYNLQPSYFLCLSDEKTPLDSSAR